MYDTHFFILAAIAVYLVIFSSMLSTVGFLNTLLFKVIPLVSAFALGLMAFKVI